MLMEMTPNRNIKLALYIHLNALSILGFVLYTKCIYFPPDLLI